MITRCSRARVGHSRVCHDGTSDARWCRFVGCDRRSAQVEFSGATSGLSNRVPCTGGQASSGTQPVKSKWTCTIPRGFHSAGTGESARLTFGFHPRGLGCFYFLHRINVKPATRPIASSAKPAGSGITEMLPWDRRSESSHARLPASSGKMISSKLPVVDRAQVPWLQFSVPPAEVRILLIAIVPPSPKKIPGASKLTNGWAPAVGYVAIGVVLPSTKTETSAPLAGISNLQVWGPAPTLISDSDRSPAPPFFLLRRNSDRFLLRGRSRMLTVRCHRAPPVSATINFGGDRGRDDGWLR